jgi:hypothetical protein
MVCPTPNQNDHDLMSVFLYFIDAFIFPNPPHRPLGVATGADSVRVQRSTELARGSATEFSFTEAGGDCGVRVITEAAGA